MYWPTNWTMHKQKSRIFAYFRTGYTELEELNCTEYHIIWSYKLLFHSRVRWITHKQHASSWLTVLGKKKNLSFSCTLTQGQKDIRSVFWSYRVLSVSGLIPILSIHEHMQNQKRPRHRTACKTHQWKQHKKKREQIGVKSDTLYHLLGIHRATLLLEDNISFILIMQY